MMTPEHPRKVSAVGKHHQVWLCLTCVGPVRFVANLVKCLELLACETGGRGGGSARVSVLRMGNVMYQVSHRLELKICWVESACAIRFNTVMK